MTSLAVRGFEEDGHAATPPKGPQLPLQFVPVHTGRSHIYVRTATGASERKEIRPGGAPEPLPVVSVLYRGTESPETPAMALREQFTDQLKASMKAGDAPRTSTLRMILARLKDTDIAARPKGVAQVPEEEIVAMLRGMVKSRRESVELYRQGNRPELAAKEEAEIAVLETFLPQQLDDAAMAAAIDAAIAETGAAAIKDMGKVMAALRAKHAATLDMGKAGPMVRARLTA